MSSARLYWDEIYFALFITPFIRASKFFGITLDWNWWHDGFHHALRDLFNGFGGFWRVPLRVASLMPRCWVWGVWQPG
ncbi:MAG UNVERIFIED_CONTAM: hypothetical protein LVT10_25695 [Anaerolineae bacterium]